MSSQRYKRKGRPLCGVNGGKGREAACFLKLGDRERKMVNKNP